MILWRCLDNVFNDKELTNIVQICDEMPLQKATVGANNTKRVDESIRNSNVCFMENNVVTSGIYERIIKAANYTNNSTFKYLLDGHEKFQYTTYDDTYNGHFTWHMDIKLDNSLEKVRKLSFTLLLNDSFEGGDFEILTSSETKAFKLPAKKGRILFFPSFIIHRVTPITKGQRKSIAGWFYGPPFK